MSDLGAIFHVKKAGVQYDAHAYTTTDECPEPNLKIKFKGSPAYIKLEAKGSGDVPCYVKKRDGGVFQVRAEAIPTGTVLFEGGKFTVPMGITVLKINYEDDDTQYVGVTPGSTHTLEIDTTEGNEYIDYEVEVYCNDHRAIWFDTAWQDEPYLGEPDASVYISWSPEINKHVTDRNDYN